MNTFQFDALAAPHVGQPIRVGGAALVSANAAMVMVHGRGATADGILALANEFQAPDVTFVAPQAAGHTWYPNRFTAPIQSNEPGLSSALSLLHGIVEKLAEQEIPAERVILLGFSQGACLALEYAARHARRYGGVVALSGGLIGPEGSPRDYAGELDETPVFLGCSDRDAHIPLQRVEESAEVFKRMGADVTKRIYPGMGHTVNQDELEFVQELVTGLTESAQSS